MEKKQKLKTCAALLMEVVSQTRSSINAHIIQEIDHSQWVTPGQSRVLFLIDQGVDTIGNLAVHQKISAPTVSRQMHGLAEKGLVLRERQKNDRRVVTLALTVKGKEILEGILSEAREWIAANLDQLETRQIETILEALGYLSDLFKSDRD